MSYGVLTTGFALKRFENIKLEIEDELREKFGEIDTDPESVFGQLIGVFSRHLAEIWEQSENIYNSEYPSTAEGLSLDNAASFVGVHRLSATSSSAIVQMKGTESTLVTSGSQFSQSLTTKLFQTLENVTISAVTLHKAIILIDTSAIDYNYDVTINDELCRYTSPHTAKTKSEIAEGIKAIINANTNVNEQVIASHVTGDEFLTVLTLDYELVGAFKTVLGTNISFQEIWTPVAVEAMETGKIPVPIASVNTIVTPVFGLDEVTNLADGQIGTNIETDAEFRIRRRQSLNIAGAGTLGSILSRVLQDIPEVSRAFIFENETDIVDGYGRPPHSFELIVAAPNIPEVNQEIADKIWERKPAGIATFGTTTMTVKDSNNQDQLINFSHSVTKYVHIKLECTTTGSDSIFPTNGSDLIKDEILRIGNTLSFGSDLLVQVYAAAGYIAGGVVSVVASVAVTDNPGDSPSWQTTNLVITPSNFPSFDLSRIIVQVI